MLICLASGLVWRWWWWCGINDNEVGRVSWRCCGSVEERSRELDQGFGHDGRLNAAVQDEKGMAHAADAGLWLPPAVEIVISGGL